MSVVLNAALAVCAAAAILAHGRKTSFRVLARYFTVLSNLLCALAAAAVVLARLAGAVPAWVLVLKYIGSVAVTVTLLTVLLFLGPTLGYKRLLTGPDLWLHLVCPVLAIVSLLLRDRPVISLPAALLLGLLPVALYGVLYLYRVVLAPPKKRWDDFYGFDRGGRLALSYTVLTAGTLAVSWALWTA